MTVTSSEQNPGVSGHYKENNKPTVNLPFKVFVMWTGEAMLKVTSNVGCAHFGSVNVQNVENGNNAQFADRTNSGRLRSRSLYSSDEAKHSTGDADGDRSHIRPRSRSFYVCDTDDEGPGHFSRSNAIRPRARSLYREDGKRNTGGIFITAKPPVKRPKGHSSKKDLTGA